MMADRAADLPMGTRGTVQNVLRPSAVPIEGSHHDHDRLLEKIGNARFVLLGEATHGSEEHYRERARITQRLLQEKGFDALAIEGDWPDVHRLHRWVRGVPGDVTADDALRSFSRFPQWMWRNSQMLEFSRWLRRHNAIVEHLDHALGGAWRIVVWAHNSHIGDARATEMGRDGELNVGQLVRERYPRDAFLVGFSTYDGQVSAASDWDAPVERKVLRPALEGSYEHLFHTLGIPSFALLPDAEGHLPEVLRHERLQRAVGVVYRPETERQSHWFHARLADELDAIIHFDRTHAVEPLERSAHWHGPDAPGTFPFAL